MESHPDLHNVEHDPTQYILHELLHELQRCVFVPLHELTHNPEQELQALWQSPPHEREQESSQ